MDQSTILEITRMGMVTAMAVAMPLLALVLFIGLLVSVFQAVTQVQEMTLTFVPKMLGVAAMLGAMGSWMLGTLVAFTRFCIEQAGLVVQ